MRFLERRLAPWVLNPLILKELRGTLRTRRFFWSHFGTLLILGSILAIMSFLEATAGGQNPERVGQTLFQVCVWAMAGAMVVILPAFSCTALASERERKCFDLLVTTRLTPWQIVWGKFGAAMVYALLFLVAALPLVQISFLFGGVSPLEVGLAFGGLTALAATVTAVSLGMSAPFKGTRWPTSLSYGASFLVLAPLVWAHVAYTFYAPAGTLAGAGISGLDGILLVEAPAFLMAVLISFFLILAARSVQHPADNRSTALRIFFLAFTAVAAGAVLYALWQLPWSRARVDQQVQMFKTLLTGTLIFLAVWALLFACEAPVASRRAEAQAGRWARFPLFRLLAPGSARGAGCVFLVGCVLIEVIGGFALHLFPDLPLAFSVQGLLLALAMLGFLCGTGFFLSTCRTPNMARAALFVWLGLSTSIPLCVQYLRGDVAVHVSGQPVTMVPARDLPPPAWVLPFLSPGLAMASWEDRVDNTPRHEQQWSWWLSRPLYAWAGAAFALVGGGLAVWGERRRKAMAKKAEEVR